MLALTLLMHKNIKLWKVFIVLMSTFLISSCATILTGTSQNISVATPACESASCSLKNSQGMWAIEETPGNVKVRKARTTLVIECKKEGALSAVATIGTGYEGAVWGNILIGGLIGLFVDMGSGAINKYTTDSVEVPLACPPEESI